MPPKIILNSEYCHITNGLPTIGAPGPTTAAMDGPLRPCTAATLGPGESSMALTSPQLVPLATDSPQLPDHSIVWLFQ